MNSILYINGCVRSASRTDRLARAVLAKLEGNTEEIRLCDADIRPLDEERLARRDELTEAGNYSDEMFDLARRFREADIIVMSAPYWDLQFPALIKIFIENITVTGLTFEYTEEGYPKGLCRGRKLIYVTTSGGSIGPYDFGYEYIRTLAEGMFGIEKTVSYRAENLDIVGNDPEQILAGTIAEIKSEEENQ